MRTNLALPSSIKRKLEAVCDKAATSSAAELRKEGERVCTEVIDGLKASASIKERALASCKAAGAGR